MYDIIVVGARCAGAPTAMLLAQSGYNVLLVDRASFPSDTMSTHMVQPRGIAYLYRWGLIDKIRNVTPILNSTCVTKEGISISVPPSVIDFEEGLQNDHGWSTCTNGRRIPVEWMIIRRTLLDKVLVNGALDAGVELRERYNVNSLFIENGVVKGIIGLTSDGKEEIIKSTLVVIADGRNSTLMNSLGGKIIKEHYTSEFCFYNYYSGLDVSDLLVPVHKRGRYAIAYGPTNDGLTLVSIWGPTSVSSSFFEKPVDNFQKVVDFCYSSLGERVKDSRIAEQFKGLRNIPNIMRDTSGPGWVAIGDASCSLTQATAAGITNAFRDVECLTGALRKVSQGKINLEEGIKEFRTNHYNDLENYYDHVAEISECKVPTLEELKLLYTVRNDPIQAARFSAVRGRVAATSKFYNKENILSIKEKMNQEDFSDSYLIKNYDSIIASYNASEPWEVS